MTNRRTTKQLREMRIERRRRPGTAVAIAGVVAALGLAIAIVAVMSGGGGDGDDGSGLRALTLTGEVNEMGMPVALTPGAPSGTASAGGVEVTGATWRMGTVPLEIAVRPAWRLVNSSEVPITLGEPHPEVRAGCCPGPLVLGAQSLDPGESTTLTFELSMHPGMDGWHDIAVHVPVLSDLGGEDVLTLAVTGDFRGTLEA